MAVVCWCLALLGSMIGCKTSEMTNTVVGRVQSPDGKSSALLVDRYYHAARVSDEFFLIIIPSTENEEKAISARNIGDSAALVATWVRKVQLRWQNNDVLLVICDSCGLEAINIEKKLDHVGSTKIVYQGFPERISNSLVGPLKSGFGSGNTWGQTGQRSPIIRPASEV